MSHPKIKTESYQNFGGINEKVSPQDMTLTEFLDLRNLDFSRPGALTGRWGSTMFVGQTFPGQISALVEYRNQTNNTPLLLIGHSGGIWSGSTSGQSQGLSLTTVSSTLTSIAWLAIAQPYFVTGQWIYTYFSGGRAVPYLGIQGSSIVYGFGETLVVNPQVQSANVLSYAVLDDQLFMCDGTKFLRYDGATTYRVGLPPVTYSGITFVSDAYGTSLADGNGAIPIGGSFGIHYLWASYTNNRGFEGPVFPITIINGKTSGWQVGASAGSPDVISSTLLDVNLSIATPFGYGISAINFYNYYDSSTGTTAAQSQDFVQIANNTWLNTPRYIGSVPASGSTFTWCKIPSANGVSSILANAGALPDANTLAYSPLGLTIGSFKNASTTVSANDAIVGYFPKYAENYQNRLFLAGFSAALSTVWFSDVAEPEGYQPDFNFEVKTNDSDQITAMKAYNTRLYFWKQRSFHALSGDNPNNFFLQTISSEFGAVNNRSVAVGDNELYFLSFKGVMRWNGANLEVISYKLEQTMNSVNWVQATSVACMTNDRNKNQLLVGVPVNGATLNNLTLVYDYVMNAWTKYDGFVPTVFNQVLNGRFVPRPTLYGTPSGVVNFFGITYLSDNGGGFSCYLKTRFLHDLGDSTEKQFRRLYVNMSPPGTTLTMPVNFYQDYGTSIVKSMTIIQSQFQTRTEFGIPAKSLSFELNSIQTSIRLELQGFTVESRMQRRV